MNEKISCSIINDLIPLYMDNAASEESRALVESHISECSDCRNIMESMNTVINDISDKDAALFKKVKNGFRKKLIIRLVITVLVCIAFFEGVQYLGAKPCEAQPSWYTVDDMKKNLEIVKINGEFYLHQSNFISEASILGPRVSQIEEGIYNFSLTDTVAHKYSRQRGWMIKDRYQALKYNGDEFPKNPKLSKYENVPVKQINYCDMDGNVIFTLWNEGDPIKEW